MDFRRAEDILKRYQQGECTEREKRLIDKWYLHELNLQEVQDTERNLLHTEQIIWKRITANLSLNTKVRTSKLWKMTAAAAAVLIFIFIGTLVIKNFSARKSYAGYSSKTDIAPGGNTAILTLANGKKVLLSGAGTDSIAREGSVLIKNTKHGIIIYKEEKGGSSSAQQNAVAMNTLTTPYKGQYSIILSDGTKVTLNAGSSISYPLNFSVGQRIVTMTGEAYFEVAHDPRKPFRVISNGQVIEVLGTHFNVNAYADEPAVKTTLLEGRVKITSSLKNSICFLRPGEQAILGNQSLKVKSVDPEDAVAWANGVIIFDGYDIQTIMRMISRWYNVSVVYEGDITTESFTGSVSRFDNVSEVLNALQLTRKVHFQLRGREITVSK